MTSEKPMPKLGAVYVKEFFIVGVVPKGFPNGIFICGDGGIQTNSSVKDALYPCIGTDRAEAESQFERAKEAYAMEADAGAVVMVKFTGGVIEKIAEQKTDSEQSVQG